MPNEIATAVDIEDLARRVNNLHATISASMNSAMATNCDRVVQVGKMLAQIKTVIGHGEWVSWQTKHLSFSLRTSQVYMQVAKNIPKLVASKNAESAFLTIEGVLKALPSPPKPARAPSTNGNPPAGRQEAPVANGNGKPPETHQEAPAAAANGKPAGSPPSPPKAKDEPPTLPSKPSVASS
jgi:hypothetical protein